jgi:hypothetical protein
MNYIEPRVLGSDASNSSPSRLRQRLNQNAQFSSQTLNPSTYSYQGDVGMNELTALSSPQYRSNDRYSSNNSFPSTSSPRTPSQLSGIASGYGADMGGYGQSQMGGYGGMNQGQMGMGGGRNQGQMGGGMGMGGGMNQGQIGGGMGMGGGMSMDNGYQDNWS